MGSEMCIRDSSYSRPQHQPHHQQQPPPPHTLYIFTTDVDTLTSAPSYNPSCLKWQTLLKIQGVPFVTRASNNHAAPGGVLPFLIPSADSTTTPTTTTLHSSSSGSDVKAIPASKLESWIEKNYPLAKPHQQQRQGHHRNPLTATYPSLLNPIRHAYLHALYLDQTAFSTLATPLYITPSSRNMFVRYALGGPLRAAALEQLVLGAPGMGGGGIGVRVDVEALYMGAEEAVEALSVILGEREWFSETEDGDDAEQQEIAHDKQDNADNDWTDASKSDFSQKGRPGTLDAAVFAYTHVILEYFAQEEVGTPARRLGEIVRGRANLVAHRERMLGRCYAR